MALTRTKAIANYHRIQPQPLCGALGAEIHDVDIASGVSEVQFAGIRRAFHEYGVIFFRDRELTPEQQIALARRWGRINVNRFFPPVDGYPEVVEVRKEPGHKNNIDGGSRSAELTGLCACGDTRYPRCRPERNRQTSIS